jgi:hypothetical protein
LFPSFVRHFPLNFNFDSLIIAGSDRCAYGN